MAKKTDLMKKAEALLVAALTPAIEHAAAALVAEAEAVATQNMINKLQGIGVSPAVASKTAAPKPATPRRQVDKTCRIAGCANPGKGPRFKWLCADHVAPPEVAPAPAEAPPGNGVTTDPPASEATPAL